MKSPGNILIATIFVLFSGTVLAEQELRFGNIKNGEKLHKSHCTRCHGTEIYTRTDRNVTSYASLQHRIGMCSSQLDIKLNTDEQQDIARYLAKYYYKF